MEILVRDDRAWIKSSTSTGIEGYIIDLITLVIWLGKLQVCGERKRRLKDDSQVLFHNRVDENIIY